MQRVYINSRKVVLETIFLEGLEKKKNYNQVYVKNSFKAAEMYRKAFGAEITREFKDENNTVYKHCELSVDGEEPIHELPWSKCCATVIDKFGVCWWILI